MEIILFLVIFVLPAIIDVILIKKNNENNVLSSAKLDEIYKKSISNKDDYVFTPDEEILKKNYAKDTQIDTLLMGTQTHQKKQNRLFGKNNDTRKE